jgi:prepilin-type N-terminal cleavage/methylation domain-containing protein
VSRSRSTRGFTLVEMLVAIVLTALLALLAHATLNGIIDARRNAAEARATLDQVMEGRQWAVGAVGSIEVGVGSFEGYPDSAIFTAWLPGPSGWMERRRAVLVHVADTLMLRIPALDIPVAIDVTGAQFDYLLEPGLDAVFVTNWNSPVSAPLAIRLRIVHAAAPVDTLLLLIGERG